MNSQNIRNLQEAYFDVYQNLDEGYKDLPKGKMLKKGIKVGADYLMRSVKAGIEGPDTTGGQIEMQKRKKSLNRAEKIDKVARGHEPEESQRKSTVNKSIGKMKRGQHPNAAIRDARAETRSQSKQRKPNRFLDNVKKGLESTFDEQVDLYDIILSHLLDEGLNVYEEDDPMTGFAKFRARMEREEAERKAGKKTTSNSTSSQSKQTSSGETTAQRARRDPEFRRQMIRDRMKTMESYDLYDVILEYLLDEGYAETPEAALAIMRNMSEDWRESICEGYKPLPEKGMRRKTEKLKNEIEGSRSSALKTPVGSKERQKILNLLNRKDDIERELGDT